MSIAAALILSDGVTTRLVHPAAMPPALRSEIEFFVLSQIEDEQRVEEAVASLVSTPVTAAPAAPAPSPALARAEARSVAKAQGYTGDFCSKCSSSRVKVSGHCTVCEDCGETSGCS